MSDLKQIRSQLLIHWINCKCNGIFSEYRNTVKRAEEHLRGNRLIYVEKIKRGRYICIFRIVGGEWEKSIRRIFTNVKNIKNIAFHEDIGKCSCSIYPISDISLFLPQMKIEKWKSKSSNYSHFYVHTYAHIPSGWESFFNENQMVIKDIHDDLAKEKETIYPPMHLVYHVFQLCSPNQIKVVILGQDPYPHNPREAMGLSFSVPIGVKLPSSLRNIYDELESEGYEVYRKSGDLTRWVKEEGVFLLNTALTVRRKTPRSHSHVWKSFSTRLIRWISENTEGVVWALWGKAAQSYTRHIDTRKHSVVMNVHPSGFNTKEWRGSKPFSAINDKLEKEINWNTIYK